MTRLAIVVEGPTELQFVQNLLASHLLPMEVYSYPRSLGGDIRVSRVASHMVNYLQGFDFVSCMVDFYGFRGKGDANPSELENLILEEISGRIRTSWDDTRVIPYV